MFFRRSWWPHGAVLGQVDGIDGWHDVDAFPDADRGPRHRRVPLGGAAVLRQRGRVPRPDPPARARAAAGAGSCSQCEAITDIDVTAADMLEQLDDELNADGRAPGVRRDAHPTPGPVERYGLSRRSTATTSTPSVEVGAPRRSRQAASNRATTIRREPCRPAGAAPALAEHRLLRRARPEPGGHPVPARRRHDDRTRRALRRGGRRMVGHHRAHAPTGVRRRRRGRRPRCHRRRDRVGHSNGADRVRRCGSCFVVVLLVAMLASARAAMMQDLQRPRRPRTRGWSAAPRRCCSATRGRAAARSSASGSSTSPRSSASRRSCSTTGSISSSSRATPSPAGPTASAWPAATGRRRSSRRSRSSTGCRSCASAPAPATTSRSISD